MTAVANPHNFSNLNRPSWGINGGQTISSMNGVHARSEMLRRSNSASSIASTSSTSSTSTVSFTPLTNGNSLQSAGDPNNWSTPQASRKRPQPKNQWAPGKPEGQADSVRPPGGRPPIAPNGMNGMPMNQQSSLLNSQSQIMSHQNAISRPGNEVLAVGSQPVLYLLSLNGTFERKTIAVPFYPETLRIGRQTNAKTVPTPINGFFDSKVLSRQHAEIWADRNGKIWIRDIKSSNGTFVNGTRLSQENRESEPRELQTQDHLELGIDIVNEDQKTVVHHKVAAKVEHAGFVSPSSNLLDMGFPDLDSTSSGMGPLAGAPFRARPGSQASVSGRMPPAAAGVVGAQPNGAAHAAHQRQFWINPITTEHIVKRLHNEMRNARLQNQDLARTGQFINALLTKDDIKNPDKPEGADSKLHMTNGNGLSFRSDGGKTRFSDPPAPPPSQPLPEKPDIARPHGPDIPSLKRSGTEKPKSNPRSTSPVRQENLGQILQLTEALNNAKKEIDSHSARVRELEEMFQKEREARLVAEDLARKIEEANIAKMNGVPEQVAEQQNRGELDKAFDLATQRPSTPEPGMVATDPEEPTVQPQPQVDPFEAATAIFQSRIDSMVSEMAGLKEQLETFRQRAEKAEAERDEDRKTLAEMVMQIRRRDEEESRRAAERKSRSPRRSSRSRPSSRGLDRILDEKASLPNGTVGDTTDDLPSEEEDPAEAPTLSRANTITPTNTELGRPNQDPTLIMQSLPYASMIGVVLLGMGMMAYINGWQPHPRLDR